MSMAIFTRSIWFFQEAQNMACGHCDNCLKKSKNKIDKSIPSKLSNQPSKIDQTNIFSLIPIPYYLI